MLVKCLGVVLEVGCLFGFFFSKSTQVNCFGSAYTSASEGQICFWLYCLPEGINVSRALKHTVTKHFVAKFSLLLKYISSTRKEGNL